MDPNHPPAIDAKLREAWRQERRFVHLRGAARLALWLVALLAVDFLLDWGLLARRGPSSGNLGLFLLTVNLAILAAALWFEWLRHLRRFNPLPVALSVEKQHPKLSSLLVSYIQCKDAAPGQPHVSQSLIEAMRDLAVERAKPIDFRSIVDFAQLRRIVTVSACVLLLFGILGAIRPNHFRVFLQRLAGSDVRYPTRTQVLSITADLTVRIGEDANITATAAGVLPAAGRLFTRPAGSNGAWKELPMASAGDPASFSRTLKGLTADTAFHVRLGDDRSAEQQIRVIDAPRIVSTSVALEYPSYLNRPAATSDQLDLTVPEGTTLRWTLQCDSAVKRCLVTIGEEQIEATLDPNGTTAHFESVAQKSFPYTFRWTERESTRDFEFDDVQFTVQVEPDAIPDVELLQPAANGLATVQKVLGLSARAGDDHGLSQAWLIYTIDGGEEKRLPVHEFSGAREGTFTYPWPLARDIEKLQPGTRLSVAVEVADLHPDRETHHRRSATRLLTLVTPEVYLDWYRSELAAQGEELRRTREAEITSSSKIEALQKEEGVPPSP